MTGRISKSHANSALRAQKFWDAGVTNWDGDSFKLDQKNMNGLFKKLDHAKSTHLLESTSEDDSAYANMMQEEMAMADLGFDCGWGDDDCFTSMPAQYQSKSQ
jgi:predicted small metal-binding protein